VSWSHALLGFTAGLVISMITSPVGVSGAVFLLPFQLTVLDVPNPQVTPTNLLFNVVAGPGALLRYYRQDGVAQPLVGQIIAGTLPGVVLGAVIRVYVASGPTVFRVIAAAVLLPLGLWLLIGSRSQVRATYRPLAPRTITALGFAVGIAGGLYGIGGGSILGPILVGYGMPVSQVAPAALTSTFLSSITGALAFAILAINASGHIAPDWSLGVACGLGGLIGGYLGAWVQPILPERALRVMLGLLAVTIAGGYLLQTLHSGFSG
jgi:uncharacterized protein